MEFNSKNDQYLDTVRALHQTVISLRSALESSRSEIIELKSKKWPIDTLQSAITALSVENHALRQQIIDSNASETPRGLQREKDGIQDLKNTVESFRSNVEKLKSIDTNLVGQEHQFSSKKNDGGTSKSVKFEDDIKLKRDLTNEDNKLIENAEIDNLKSDKKSVDTNSKSVDLNNISKVLYFEKTHIKKTIENREDLNVKSSLINTQTEEKQDLRFEHIHSSTSDERNLNITTEIQVTNQIDLHKKSSSHEDNSNINLEFGNTSISQQIGIEAVDDGVKTRTQNYVDALVEENIRIGRTNEDDNVDLHVASSSSKDTRKNSKSDAHNLIKEVVINEKVADITLNFEDQDLSKTFTKECAKNEYVVFEPISTSTPRKAEDERTITVSINLDIHKKTKRKRRKSKMENKDSDLRNPEQILQHSISTDLLNQELDNIELIFTNEDTKETNLKEEMISIDGVNEDLLSAIGQQSGEVSDKELEDDVFNDNFENENQENKYHNVSTSSSTRREMRGLKKSSNKSTQEEFQAQLTQGLENAQNPHIYNSKSDNSLNHDDKSYSFPDSSFENKSLEKDESFDRFEERIRIVETDMSKVGIHDTLDYGFGRRNTCPNPLQYRPIVHREALGKGLNARKTRPILAHSNAARRESGAQTDISALPNNNWRSESSLAYKVRVGDNFTTLPSKYPHPGSKLRLSEKTTVEARRVLLSDIGFTSMVPELSRSADHLCPNPPLKVPNYGQFLRTPDYSPGYTSQKFTWNSISPCDSQSRYSSLYPLASPPTNSQAQTLAQPPYRRCSAPVSPCRYGLSHNASSSSRRQLSTSAGKLVRFANGSMPELRSDWYSGGGNMGSSDSTDSLIDEAEQYLRRSIDNILLTHNGSKDIARPYGSMSLSSLRRASAPEPASDTAPPHGWRPFLPRQARDIRLDNWVKVISPEGRVRGGRVRYVGHLLVEQNDQFVGVQLCTPEGPSDGSYNNRRYFQCEPYHGIFVPFKKVIMAWKP